MKQIFFTIIASLNFCALSAQETVVSPSRNDSLLITTELKQGRMNFWKYAGNSANRFLFGVSYDFMNFTNDRLLQDKWGISITSKIITMPFIFDIHTSVHSFDTPDVEQLIIDRNYESYLRDFSSDFNNPNFDRNHPYIEQYKIRGYNISPSLSFCPLPFLPLKPQTQTNLSERFIPYIGVGYNLYIESINYSDYYQTQWTEYNEDTSTEHTFNYSGDYEDAYFIHSFLCKVGMIYSIKNISIIAEYGHCFNNNRANIHQSFSVGLAIKRMGIAESRKPKKVFEHDLKFIK
jgi:hypothetical protein